MKKYISPEIEITVFVNEKVLGGSSVLQDNETEPIIRKMKIFDD